MGNIACVPQAPGGLRGSFRRKPSLKNEQNGKKKLPSFFGIEGGQEGDTTTDKILQYIPAKIIQNQENQKENLDQRFSSPFKKGQRNNLFRNEGKMIYYSKVKLKFQHCQDWEIKHNSGNVAHGDFLGLLHSPWYKDNPQNVSLLQEVCDCFLELYESYLYLQATGSNGFNYQEWLPLKELTVFQIESGKSPGQQQDPAFIIASSLLKPLTVFCPTEAELKQWLYHLKKQIHLSGGNLSFSFFFQNNLKHNSMRNDNLSWSVQNMLLQECRGTQRETLGDVLCISKVKLQHLPFQEQHDRLLALYPSTLVIVSEEPNGLCFKGELPLNAIQVLFEENEKTSFLIEGRLINSIRVSCHSYKDYQDWLYCLTTAQFRNTDFSCSGSESFSGSKPPQPSQFTGSGRGSLTSDGRTNSWASGGRVTTLTHLSQTSGSLPDGQSFVLMPDGRLVEDTVSPGYSQPLHYLAQANWPTAVPTQDLRRGGSARKSKGKCGPCNQQLPSQDSDRSICSLIPENPNGDLLSPVYNEPYSAHSSQHHPTAPPAHLDRGSISSLREEHLSSSLHPPDGNVGLYDLPVASGSCRDSGAYHDYAELQSFQSDYSYDNLWEAEEKEPGTPHTSPSPVQEIYQV
ncbi:PREDICTED: pleckstrin homology domain-containing family N member 1 [Acanthisitta chloris]|uniref:pleckstrin homology domain-containing family N member 1 n=1 Tax=Acanthisitta chloris TaxID=57068 RepID=UPI0004F0F67F|nr:PREDICTED: pleckstrin homology domain-containing family N member 1 [Acanthisitta chloris]